MADIDFSVTNNTPENDKKAPLHRVIAENISQKISSGSLKAGEKLPSERQIAQQYQASRATVRTALQHLEQEGIISRRDRRSAIVTLRRDVKPNLRIAVGNHSLMRALKVLNDKQLLPPRTQLHAVNLACPRVINHLVTQPASGADIIICDIEYVNARRSNEESFVPMKMSSLGDVKIEPQLLSTCMEQGRLMAIPLGVSPMILYYNRAMMDEIGASVPQNNWHWDQLVDLGSRQVKSGRFGLQMKPGFAQLTAMFTGFGGMLFRPDGVLATDNNSAFDSAIHFLSEHIGGSGIIAPITTEISIDLFADRRCAMAIEGFEKYKCYRDELGDDLGVTCLPGARSEGRVARAIIMMVLKPMEDTQPIEDMVRSLLNNAVQAVIAGEGIAAPVRKDLLSQDFLQNAGVPADLAALLVSELGDMKPANVPGTDRLAVAVRRLFNEIWLGLDTEEAILQRMRQLK